MVVVIIVVVVAVDVCSVVDVWVDVDGCVDDCGCDGVNVFVVVVTLSLLLAPRVYTLLLCVLRL